MSSQINIEDAGRRMAEGVRSAFMIVGLVAVVVGVAILVWPAKTAMIVAAILSIQAIIAGLFYIAVGLSMHSRSGWSRIGNIILGALYIIAGIILFTNLSASVAILQVIVGVLIGAVWLVEGIMTITTMGSSPSKGASVLYGVISILAGLALLFAPALYVWLLWWLLGATLVIMGLVQLYRAFTFGRMVKAA